MLKWIMLHKKAVLLDVDGVVMRSRAVASVVSAKCAQFVGRKLNVSEAEAQRINRALYTKHGHTLLGLHKECGIYVTQAEFVKHVYDIETFRVLRDQPIVEPQFYNICTWCADKGIPLWLFSNAPRVWSMSVIVLNDIPVEIQPNILDLDGHLKPEPEVYRHVEETVPADKLIFVDDSAANLAPIEGNPRWVPILCEDDLDTVVRKVYKA